MKRRVNIDYKNKPETKPRTADSDFYERWYAKFGEPRTITMRGDEFMQRLKEMIDFE